MHERIDNKTIKNILVVRNDRFGEFLLNIPAFRALKETFINAKLIAVIDPYLKELVDNVAYIDEVMEWGRGKHSWLVKLQLARLLSKKNIDMAVMLNPSKDFSIISFLSRIPIRVGYDRKWGFLLTHKIKDKKHLGQKHEIEYNLELVSLVGAKTEDKALFISVGDNTVNDLLKDVKEYSNLVAVHPWTSDPVKQWPLERFHALTQRLMGELNLKVLIVGAKDEADKDTYFRDNFAEKLINLAGKTTLKELAGILKECKMLISGDSGPVHLACAVNTPVLAIFRGDIPGKAARRWGPWGNRHIVVEKDDLCDITTDEVFQKAKEMLSK